MYAEKTEKKDKLPRVFALRERASAHTNQSAGWFVSKIASLLPANVSFVFFGDSTRNSFVVWDKDGKNFYPFDGDAHPSPEIVKRVQ